MNEFKGDKRTKEYKEWKASFDNKSKGLGDDIAKFTKATGINKVVKAIAPDCGCDKRQQKLNDKFSYKKVNCLNQEDYEYLDNIFKNAKRVTAEQQTKMKDIYQRTFNRKIVSTCLTCSFVKSIYNPLKKLYNA